MRLPAIVAALIMSVVSAASAQTAGVAVQVSRGKKIPTVAQLQLVLRPGDFVRDVLGWQKADPKCDLRTDPSRPIAIPAAFQTLYANVEAAGGRNFVTLGFNNKFCGQMPAGGGENFPNTPELRAEFAAYAAGVVRQVPALGGVSIWNELNGTWDGGYKTRADKLTAHCQLANAVVTEIRKVDAQIPIAIGATIGANVDEWFIQMFDVYGCMGKGDSTIWLDVHPYLASKRIPPLQLPDWQAFADSVRAIRADRITNPLIATEWGAKAAYVFTLGHPHSNYMRVFRTRMLGTDPKWAGFIWFEMLYDRNNPNAGLFDAAGNLTGFGNQYIAEFVR
jgi:hypothetical protein